MAGVPERSVGMRVADQRQASAVPEERVCLFEHVREPPPAGGGVGVEAGGLHLLAGRLGLERPDGGERVLLDRQRFGEVRG